LREREILTNKQTNKQTKSRFGGIWQSHRDRKVSTHTKRYLNVLNFTLSICSFVASFVYFLLLLFSLLGSLLIHGKSPKKFLKIEKKEKKKKLLGNTHTHTVVSVLSIFDIFMSLLHVLCKGIKVIHKVIPSFIPSLTPFLNPFFVCFMPSCLLISPKVSQIGG
jgi:hypothetical protein